MGIKELISLRVAISCAFLEELPKSIALHVAVFKIARKLPINCVCV